MPSLTTQCLILYHPADQARVLQVRAALAGLKVTAWLDVDGLEPGKFTLEQWAEAVQAHSHIFLFWSAAAAGDQRLLQPHYLLALSQHGSVVPICLDDTEVPGPLKPYCAIRGAGVLAPEALACLLEASVSGRRLPSGPRLAVMDVPWVLAPGEPLELLILRPAAGQPVTPALLRAVLDRVAQQPTGRPALLLCPYGAAPGAAAGEITMLLAEHCPPDTAVVVSFDSLPYNEIPDRQQVQPGGDAATAWPVTAVWIGGQPAYQVDLGAPAALARVGPRIPVFRTPAGFTFSVLAMAPAPGDPPSPAGSLAGLFAVGLCAAPTGPDRLDLCLLLTPDAA
ncbi:MAG: hypothetical protein JWN15_410, partial [Firmicutes bacterium]|nr:hypothetical protein [Bacillota bacterium]